MVDAEKIFTQRFKKKLDCTCRHCGQPITTAEDMIYVQTKRKEDIFYHAGCFREGAVRFTEVK